MRKRSQLRVDCQDQRARFLDDLQIRIRHFASVLAHDMFETHPSCDPGGGVGRELIAVYLFDPQGGFLEARIDDLGPRRQLDQDRARKLPEHRLAELGHVVYQRIAVRPFEVERFGTTFGLIPRPPESVESQRAGWWVEVRPGNYMAFHEPWDSGEYDT